jgi:fructose/tagatose bisphosphate aldolase
MMLKEKLQELARMIERSIALDEDMQPVIRDKASIRNEIALLLQHAVFSPMPERGLAQWLIRECARRLGCIPASIHAFYRARGRGDTRLDFTVPALNLRALPYHAARAAFRAAASLDAHALIFEIARSEIGYTDQRPAEYASCVLAAAIAEQFEGPIFLQGDHFQTSASRFAKDAQQEIDALQALITEAIQAGFFNIDIDTSTLVDLSKSTIPEQQELNFTNSAQLGAFVRSRQPAGMDISIGGEIGEVGGHNSTEPELRAYMDGFNRTLQSLAPGASGLSKISIQTGTSHGGVVLPDGSIARVKVDFDTIERLSRIARTEYGLGGAVQHGASTLPLEAFPHFPKSGACEVHLATNFQNLLFEQLPEEMVRKMYRFLDEHHAKERKPGETDEQFYYKTRKRCLGPFKKQLWDLPDDVKNNVQASWEEQFQILFHSLNIKGTAEEISRTIELTPLHISAAAYAGLSETGDEARDLAD